MKINFSISIRLCFIILFSIAFCRHGVSQDLEEIRQMGDTSAYSIKYLDEHTFLIQTATYSDISDYVFFIQKLNDDGETLATVKIWDEESLVDTIIPYFSEIYKFRNQDPCFFFLKRRVNSDTCTFHKAIIHEDMNLSFEDLNWRGTDFNEGMLGGYLYEKTVESIINKDGGVFFSYRTNNDSIGLVSFDETGNVLAEGRLETHPFVELGYGFVITPDSLGFRIIRHVPTEGSFGYSCFTFDAELNIVDTIENVDQYSYPPVSCSELAYFRFNPYSGKTYSITHWSVPAYNGHPEIKDDIVMSVYDENMVQTNYVWGIHTPTNSFAGYKNTINFGSANDVYMAGGLDGTIPRSLYVVYMDQDLNKYGEIYYVHPSRYLLTRCVVACPDGGCLVYCDAYDEHSFVGEKCIFKVTISDFLNVEEAHNAGFAVATAYPNPGGSEMHIRTTVENAAVEVYDMNGRLVAQQPVTETETVLDATGWAAGTYIWKVISAGKDVESGKWVKE